MKLRFAWHVASAFGVSIAQQLIGLFRQVLIAAFFGLSREFDAYLVVYALVTMVVFNLAGVFDTVAVARLVQIHGRDGEETFWRTSNRILLLSCAFGVVFAATTIALLWIAMPILTAGFSPAERVFVGHIGWYFIPWIVVIVPYYALSAHLKAVWQFSWVFAAELVVMVVSIAILWFEHASVAALPIAYGGGYAVAALLLLARRGFRRNAATATSPHLINSMSKQYLATQVGTANGFADRYFQSFLIPGGISVLGYVGLIVNSLSSLMTFREIYVVPLAVEAGREQRLERMLQGLVLISIPCTFFLIIYAEPIVSVLLQRGKFTPEAAAVTAAILRILALSLLLSTVLAPLERMFQILDRLVFTQVRYLIALAATLVFQSFFVFYLAMDVRGLAWGSVCNSAVVLASVILMVRRCGIVVRWRGFFANAAFATVTAAVAMGISWPVASHFTGLGQLIMATGLYGLVVASSYFMARARLRIIVG
jgi:putative peptidoglycan lipid II flippase